MTSFLCPPAARGGRTHIDPQRRQLLVPDAGLWVTWSCVLGQGGREGRPGHYQRGKVKSFLRRRERKVPRGHVQMWFRVVSAEDPSLVLDLAGAERARWVVAGRFDFGVVASAEALRSRGIQAGASGDLGGV